MAQTPMRRDHTAVFIVASFCFVIATNQAFAQLINPNTPLSVFGVCRLIEGEARRNGLPPAYFARLIWQESRFEADAVSPEGKQGIAQFLPETAEKRRLEDPFNTREAIPKSAEYLAFLRVNFGNLGLAAAAYIAGEETVEQWLKGARKLASETEQYVLEITGEPIDVFRDRRRRIRTIPLREGQRFQDACVALPLESDDGTSMPQILSMPWAIQVAAHFDSAVAKRKWVDIKTRHGSLIGARPVAISLSPTSRGNRPLYTVRIGEESRSAANALCAELKALGTPCLVARNEDQ
ncbi:MAG: lytic transglycosylase domain-containing protein [Pseudomonadota bacterium]